MERPWAFWRRVEYGGGFLLLLTLFGVLVYRSFFYVPPSCTDLRMNGTERGIDCGGGCTRICAIDVLPLEVVWTESFRISDGQYNAVAYINNANRDTGTAEITYTFVLSDEEGVITERTGTSALPPYGEYPIFEGRIETGDRVPTKTEIVFEKDVFWQKGGTGKEQFKVLGRSLSGADLKPRLTARIENTLLEKEEDVEVVAIIFDSKRKPLTVSRAIVREFSPRSTEEVVFTWPNPIAGTLRSCDIPTDVLLAIDLSGSMNNDGDNPPQPLTSVLESARTFVEKLHEKDKSGLVTYATVGTTSRELSSDHRALSTRIGELSIDPKEETGATNIGDAIRLMREELESSRHSEEARKVGILLTDGLATAPDIEPEQFATGEADLLKSAGTLFFTIGLGSGLNEPFLEALASDRALYHRAPGTEDLDRIYNAISKSICEDGPTLIEIIPKPTRLYE